MEKVKGFAFKYATQYVWYNSSVTDDTLIEEVRNSLRSVIDPELGISVVELGLVYGIEVGELGGVVINITLTTPTCPLTDTIEQDIRDAVAPLTEHVDVNWVWNPPWTTDMITSEGRMQLAAIGINI